MLKINILDAIRINQSKKEFILIDLNDDKDKIIGYKLTNELQHKNKFDTFRVLSCIKKELKTLTINI